MIPNTQIDDIRNKADIVAVISEYVPLKKRGKNYLGLCPFHAEKTPSFTVSPDKGIWHCFGCNEGGNIFAFLSKIENISFVESVIMLGDKAGIKVESQGDPRENAEKDRYMGIMGMAAAFYRQQLAEDVAAAKEYIEKRGISAEASEKFMLGYAPDRWEALYEHLFRKGVSQKDMLAVGLIMERKDGSGFYDRFRNRLMFPIFNMRGKVIGFSGRTLGKDDEAKYINSPDSPIYNKGYNLYGLYATKDAIKAEEFTILVEGNVDLLTCYQFGIRNVVAPLGTAFTPNQAKLLGRFTKSVIIVFDKDTAGLAAAAKTSQILRDSEIGVFVAGITGGKDPDEAIRKNGRDKFIEDLKNAKPWMEYIIEEILKKHNLKQVEERSKAVREVSKILAGETDTIAQKEYIKILAARTGIDAATIEAEVKKQDYYGGRVSSSSASSRYSVEKPAGKLAAAEETLIKIVLNDGSQLAHFRKSVDWHDLTNPAFRTMSEILQKVDLEGPAKDDLPNFLMENMPDEEGKKLLTKMTVSELPEGDHEKMLEDCANTLKAHHVRSKLDELRMEMSNAEKVKDFDRVNELHKQFNEYSAIFRTLEKVT